MTGLRDIEQAVAISHTLDDASWVASAYVVLAYWSWRSEGPARALELYTKAIEWATVRGMTGEAMWAKGESVWPLFDLGKWNELLRRADEVTASAQIEEDGQIKAIALPYKARVLAERGRMDEAASLERQFLAMAREIGDLQVLVPALATASVIRHELGDQPASRELIDELAGCTQGAPPWRARFLPDAVRVLLAAGDGAAAAKLIVAEEELSCARDRCSSFGAHALVIEARGNVEQAAMMHTEAARRWAEYGIGHEQAHALVGAGRCALSLGRRRRAAELLGQARTLFDQMGAHRSAARAAVYLKDAAALSS
jgi:tetratricopeptide (TPR) repeat protein